MYNCNLINANELRHDLEYTGAIFQTTIDSEVIAYHIARERLNTDRVEDAVLRACRKLKGAYSLIVMSPRKLIGARDPFGFKPLCIGKRDHAYIITSETCALETIDAEFVRDVLPGEVVTISKDGTIHSDTSLCISQEKEARCIFEYIYFARPDSYIDGVSVYASRIRAGQFLAMDSYVEADLVVGVPESGNAAALGYAMQSGIPYGNAFVKNGYVGRTFIKPKQSNRESAVRVKLNVLKEAVNGKRIIMIDDSNIQREDILPSEKARAYAMKYEAMKHQGSKGGSTLDEVGEAAGESGKTVQRYVWLARLSDGLLDMVDKKKIGIAQGVDISFLSGEAQQWVSATLEETGSGVNASQSAKLKEYGKSGELTPAMVRLILTEEKPKERKVTIKGDKISRYFPEDYSNDDIEGVILELLEEWQRKQ